MKIIKVRVSDEEMDANAAEKMPYVKKAVASAKSVLSIFEREYPRDKRPRKAIEAAEDWVKNPTGSNREKADKAAAVAAYSAAKSESATTEAAGYAAAYAAGAAASATIKAASSDASKAIVKAAKAK